MRPDVLGPTRQIVSGKLEHFRAAISIASHPLADVVVDVPADLQAAVDCVSQMRHGVSAWRARQLETLRVIVESPDLVQMSAQIMDLALPHVRWAVGKHAHPALIMVFIDALEWPDSHFAYRHYVVGWPVVGWPADTSLYQHHSAKEMAQDASDYVHPEKLAHTNSHSNAHLAASMQHGFRRASQQADLSRLAAYNASHEASLKKVLESGTAEGPLERWALNSRFGKGLWRASPCHAVWQRDPAHIGDLAYGKWRLVDDATRSKINAAFRLVEKVSFP